MSPADVSTPVAVTHQTAETRFVDAGGVRLAFRRFGAPGAAPLLMLQHFRATSTTGIPR